MSATISPSILNCDPLDIRSELAKIANADYAHVDVMDNHFVPNLTWGPSVVEAVAKEEILPVDAHLMIANPDRWAPAYAEAGAASVTFHAEAADAPIRLARELRRLGARAGLGLRPDTAVEAYLPLISEFDMFLVMTVEPGFGGQPFLPHVLGKITTLRKHLSATGQELAIQVDGGVNRETIIAAAQAGANTFVAGSAVFRAEDAAEEIEVLRRLAEAHCHRR